MIVFFFNKTISSNYKKHSFNSKNKIAYLFVLLYFLFFCFFRMEILVY